MIYRTILLLIFIFSSSCDSTKYVTIDNTPYKVVVGPGLVFINENLYADETEVTNVMYLEYLDWVKEIFGENSMEFERIQVDKSVWNTTEFSVELNEKYFELPYFAEYPIVGISLEQAELYSKWRTDRVAQLLLTRKGLIKSEFIYSKDNYFSIDRYVNGDYEWIINKENMLVPEYKIPTKSEWELIAGLGSNYPNGIDITLRENKKVVDKYKYLYNTKEFHSDSLSKAEKAKMGCGEATCMVYVFAVNLYGLYGTLGNVSELIATQGISKGGNWKNRLTENQIQHDFQVATPNAWTGFRNIARPRLLKIKDGNP